MFFSQGFQRVYSIRYHIDTRRPLQPKSVVVSSFHPVNVCRFLVYICVVCEHLIQHIYVQEGLCNALVFALHAFLTPFVLARCSSAVSLRELKLWL